MMWSSSWCGALGLILGALAWMVPTSGWAGSPKKTPNEERLREAENLQRDCEQLYNELRHDEAAELAERACSILEEELGRSSAKHAECISNLGLVRMAQEAHEEAKLLFEQALAINKEILNHDHPDVANNLSNLGLLYVAQGAYKEAGLILEEALTINEKALGPDHPDVANSLSNLAQLHYIQGAYEMAKPLFRRALAVRRKTLGPHHHDVAVSLNDLAMLHSAQGAYEEAEPLFRQALAIDEKALGAHHPQVATRLSNLATLYNVQGAYKKAATLYEQALTISEKTLGPNHPQIATELNNFALLHNTMGAHEEAESLHKRALTIRMKTLGPDHPDTAISLANLASLYSDQGAYEKAKPLYERALVILEAALGPHHPHVATNLGNLASLHISQKNYNEAEPLYERALAIREKALGPHHPHIAVSLINLTDLYVSQGAHKKAELTLERALAIFEKALGPHHPHVADSLERMANLHNVQGAYQKAEPLHERALAIRERALGTHHSDVATSLSNMAILYENQGRYNSALALRRRALGIQEMNLVRTLTVADESRRLAYASTLSGSLHYTISLHLRVAPEHDSIAHIALTTLLRRKNRVQDLVSQSTVALRRSLPEEKQYLLVELSNVDSGIATLTTRNPGNLTDEHYTQKLYELQEQRDQLWSELAIHSAIVEGLDHPVTIEDVQRTLSAGSVLLELAQYAPQHDDAGAHVLKHEPKPPPRYAAYLVFPDHIDSIDLGPAAPIDEHIRTFRTTLQNKQAIPTDLYDAVMRPIVAKLGSTHHLIIAPAGRLSHVPFGALHDGERYLIEQYDLRYVTTGRDLLDPPPSPPVTTTPVTIVANPTGSHLRDAELEADFLESFFPAPRVLRRDQATETNLRTVERPLILHMATHGFFGLPRNERDNPMLRSGLVLADIEQVDVDRELDDGRLTAYEVSGMDLRGTQLVVLSACETGMGATDVTKTKTGNVDMSEGVFGLRRAFAMAGARTTVMSLWQVSGMTAQRTMEAYYRKLAEGQGPGEAMQAVQLEMLHTEEHRHPKDWAAFIVSGDDDPLVFPAGQEPREPDPGPPPVRGARGCTIDAPRSDHNPAGTLLLGLLGLAALRRRHS